MKKGGQLVLVFLILAIIFCLASFVLAAGLSWTQNDWSGGSGQSAWSNNTKYSSATSVVATTSSITLETNSGWYDTAWKYRQSVSVTNNSGSALSSFQIPIYLNTAQLISASKMKSDCSDIRVVDASGTSLPLWTATAPTADVCNKTATKLWVKLSSLPTAGTTLYIYYGNANATSASNGNNVFPIFADFTTGSALPSTWTKTDIGTAGTATVGSGVLTMSNTNGEDVWYRVYGGTHVYSTTTVTGSFVAESIVNSQTNSDPWAKTGITVQNAVSSGVSNGQAFIIVTPGNGIAFQYQSSSGDTCTGGCTAPNTQTNSGAASFPMFLKLVKDASSQISGYFSSNGLTWSQRGSTATVDGTASTQYVTLFITPHNKTGGTSTSTYSFFFVRSFTASEPTVGSVQSEQTAYVSSGSLTSSIFDTGGSTNLTTATFTTLTGANNSIAVKIRTSNNADMSGATDFATCNAVSSGQTISGNNCVTNQHRYLQYQVSLSGGTTTPTFQSLSIDFSDIGTPIISDVVKNITNNSADITWATNENASAFIRFGPSTSYGAISDTTSLALSHHLVINNLPSCTLYHYRIYAEDSSGNIGTTADATFITSGCTDEASISATGLNSISNSSGGTLTQGNLSLTVPSSFTSEASSVVFQASQLDASNFFATAGTPSNKQQVGSTVFNLKAFSGGTTTIPTFNNAITVTLSYTAGDLTGGVDENSLVIYRYDNSAWNPLTNCSVNTSAKTVTCQTTAFSDFAIFGSVQNTTSASVSTVSSVFSGGSSSIQNRINNLIAMGKLAEANKLKQEWSKLLTASSSSAKSASTTSLFKFTRNLAMKSEGEDVLALQKFLIEQKAGPCAKELERVGVTGYFGSYTKNALGEWQKANGIRPWSGYFGPKTRAKMGK